MRTRWTQHATARSYRQRTDVRKSGATCHTDVYIHKGSEKGGGLISICIGRCGCGNVYRVLPTSIRVRDQCTARPPRIFPVSWPIFPTDRPRKRNFRGKFEIFFFRTVPRWATRHLALPLFFFFFVANQDASPYSRDGFAL